MLAVLVKVYRKQIVEYNVFILPRWVKKKKKAKPRNRELCKGVIREVTIITIIDGRAC